MQGQIQNVSELVGLIQAVELFEVLFDVGCVTVMRFVKTLSVAVLALMEGQRSRFLIALLVCRPHHGRPFDVLWIVQRL